MAFAINGTEPFAWLAGLAPGEQEALRAAGLDGALAFFAPDQLEAARQALAAPGCRLAVTGSLLAGEAAAALLAAAPPPAGDGAAPPAPRFVVLAGGERLEIFQPFVDADRLYYLSAAAPPAAALPALLRAAWAAAAPAAEPAAAAIPPAELAAFAGSLGDARSQAAASRVAQDALRRYFDAEQVACFMVDRATDTLVREEGGQESQQSAAVGLVAFAGRTGETLSLADLEADPRFEADADGPGGAGRAFLALPVAGSVQPVLAVLALWRRPGQAPFGGDELQRLQRLADAWRPHFERLAFETELGATHRRQIFRAEAVQQYSRGFGQEGHLLELTPAWVRRAYPVLLLLLLFLLVFTILARHHEYAGGPAVLRSAGRIELTARQSGSADAIEVAPGERVRQGQLLVRFYGAEEESEAQRIGRELEAALLERLRNPADRGAEQALAALRAEHEAALARLEERSLRAPRDGVVSEIRVRPGQWTAPGEVVLSLSEGEGRLGLLAFLPGRYLPQLKAGMPLRLELEGYPYAYQHLAVERVSPEILGPAEARRLLPPGAADALQIDGPVVLVEARLLAPELESDGRTFTLHDGMKGTAEVRVRQERLILSLVPALRALFAPRHAEAGWQ